MHYIYTCIYVYIYVNIFIYIRICIVFYVLRVQVNIKFMKENGYLLDGPGQNSTLQFAKAIINWKRTPINIDYL